MICLLFYFFFAFEEGHFFFKLAAQVYLFVVNPTTSCFFHLFIEF